MNDTFQPAEVVPPHLVPKKLTEFLESLQRTFKIGTYYPAGHTVLDQAVHLFQRNLQEICDEKRFVTIELQGDAILIEGVALTLITNAVRELKKLLQDLGISRVEMDRTLGLAELMQFVRTLLLGRAQMKSAKQFTQARIEDLPASTRIVQKEFMVDESSILVSSQSDDDGQNLESIFRVLADQGLNRTQISQCRDFLNSLANRFKGRPLGIKGLPSVSWSDVSKLLVKVVTKAHHLSDASDGDLKHNDLNALSTIFNGLQQELDDQQSRDTLSLLVSVFNRSQLIKKPEMAETGEKKKNSRPHDNATEMTIAQLQSYVTDFQSEVKLIEKIKQIDHQEELSILLQLLQYPQEAEDGAAIQRNIRQIFTISLSPREVDVLIKGVLQLTECQQPERFREAVDLLTQELRDFKNFSSLHFLVMLSHKLSSDQKLRIWPTIVNEMLLVGRRPDQRRLFAELAGNAAEQQIPVVRKLWPELENLGALKERKLAPDIFDPQVKTAYPLYAILLESTMRTQIASRILGSLKAEPPDWLIEATAPLLQLTQPQHLKFLYTYLALAHQNTLPVNLRIMAGRLVVEQLSAMSEEERNEPWVAKTIQVTGEMQVEGTRELLEKILTEKKMMVVPKWSAPCRRAATEAMKSLKRKPLG